mmetsp:Transcript_5840/g.8718  ORF Transcript_5840/g.8718 Transcript_5840/m.8718 type:complete len:717 (-) Transcript_5840:154-2304(-)
MTSVASMSSSEHQAALGGRVKEVMVDSRINKVLAMRTDSVAMLEALDAISEFYNDNTVDARRMLKQDLELQNIQLAKRFLSEFDEVKTRITAVENLSSNLQAACNILESKVKNADENMKSFMEKASELENKRNHFSSQSKEIQLFLSRFQLSDDEVDLLYHANLDNADSAEKFFDSLGRLKAAYSDCKSMVEKHFKSVGFELLEILGQHQETAYQHLFDWVKKKCDLLAETGSSDDLETNNKMQIAIRFLNKLPIYFSQCQDLLVNSRRTQLVQKFIQALTQGETANMAPSKSLRAIDLNAHDAVKYVGGMLAWMHQAVATEQEFLEAIFGEVPTRHSSPRPKGPNGGKSQQVAEKEEGDAHHVEGSKSATQLGALSVPELLARCLQGLGRPLRVRIVQTLESRAGLEVLYAMSDLLAFYEATFHRIVPIENAVHSTVRGCLIECKRLFASSLHKQAELLTQSHVSYPLDLKASHVTRECAAQIQEILKVFNCSLSVAPVDVTDACHIDAVLGNIIQPLLQSCRLGCQALPAAEMALFMLNNVSVIQHEILETSKRYRDQQSQDSHVDSKLSWLEMLETEASTWVDILVREEVGRTLKRSDLDKLMELIEIVPAGLRAVDQVGLGQDRVGTVMRSFYASLFSTVAPQFERLHDPLLREEIRNRTAYRIAEAHAKMFAFISQAANGYDAAILSHTTEEVKVLLGCSSGGENAMKSVG